MFALSALFCAHPTPAAAAAKTVADPVQQALGEDLEKAKNLPAALQKKANQGLSVLRSAALVLIGCSFVISLIKTAYGAVRGDGYVWAGALAAVVSALCFVAVLHAKTILYLIAQYAEAP